MVHQLDDGIGDVDRRIDVGEAIFVLDADKPMALRSSQAFHKVTQLAGELETSNERLVSLNRLKDAFLANATHGHRG